MIFASHFFLRVQPAGLNVLPEFIITESEVVCKLFLRNFLSTAMKKILACNAGIVYIKTK